METTSLAALRPGSAMQLMITASAPSLSASWTLATVSGTAKASSYALSREAGPLSRKTLLISSSCLAAALNSRRMSGPKLSVIMGVTTRIFNPLHPLPAGHTCPQRARSQCHSQNSAGPPLHPCRRPPLGCTGYAQHGHPEALAQPLRGDRLTGLQLQNHDQVRHGDDYLPIQDAHQVLILEVELEDT